MADNNLPPLHDEDTSETQRPQSEKTQANPRAPQEDTQLNRKHRTQMLKKAPPAPNPRQVQAMAPRQRRQAPPSGYVPRSRQEVQPKDSALYLPWWSLVLMLVAVLVISFGVIGIIYLLGNSDNNALSQPEPIIMIVTADTSNLGGVSAQGVQQAASTEIISGQNAPSELQLSGPTLAPVQISPTPAAIQIGSVVLVDGVDVNTLNVRSSPSLTESSVLFRAEEGELFTVVDGPQTSDGFTWWQIQDATDVNRIGWAVSNFLTVQAQ